MGRARILAVDDQRYFRELTEALLREEGFDVRTACSGEDALHLLEREDFDVVLTDLVMPGIDGTELVRKVKERLPDQDVIVVTGVVDVRTAVGAMKMGATDYILKPFDRTDLTEAIDRVLNRQRLRDEHARLMEENLEFMGVLSLFERAVGLFSSLAVEPLAERLVEGLCLETRAQSAVVWVAEELGATDFELAGARGLIRVDEEPPTIEWSQRIAEVCPALAEERSALVEADERAGRGPSLYVALRFGGEPIGLVMLADKVDAEAFTEADRAMAEKYCDFGATALRNALRFRALERRSLRDPDTRAYTQAYFEDVVRNEIQKANRFGHRFSILRLEVDAHAVRRARRGRAAGEEADRRQLEALAHVIDSALRSTDLLASSGTRGYSILLPQTDALGAGILAQRIRAAIAAEEGPDAPPPVLITSVTYPVDGTQSESLFRTLDERLNEIPESLLATRPEFARSQALDPLFDRMLELGSVEPVEVEGQILQFVLEDVARRPMDRGVLFVSPGARWLPEVLDIVHDMRGQESRTEVVLIAEAEEQEPIANLTWATKFSLDARRPFLVHFGDAPAYAMIGQITLAGARAPIFQTADRALVEHLAFELQRELGIVLSI